MEEEQTEIPDIKETTKEKRQKNMAKARNSRKEKFSEQKNSKKILDRIKEEYNINEINDCVEIKPKKIKKKVKVIEPVLSESEEESEEEVIYVKKPKTKKRKKRKLFMFQNLHLKNQKKNMKKNHPKELINYYIIDHNNTEQIIIMNGNFYIN